MLGLLAFGVTGCASWRSADAPMYTQTDTSRCTLHADTLLVLLPGVYSHPDEFVREGFVRAVHDARLAVDLVRVDAHLNYYERKTFVARLNQDVIVPAQARGYRAIWIAGISLGGFGGLIYAKEHPSDVAGLVALAPYLGEAAIWPWLNGDADAAPGHPPLYLGYGTADRFATSNGLLAAKLPPSRVFTTDGGHDWAPWLRLWKAMLPTLPLPRCPT